MALDIPTLALPVTLENIQITSEYEIKRAYDKFFNLNVDVELTEFPAKFPVKCKLHVKDTNDDVANILVNLRMAKWIKEPPKNQNNNNIGLLIDYW